LPILIIKTIGLYDTSIEILNHVRNVKLFNDVVVHLKKIVYDSFIALRKEMGYLDEKLQFGVTSLHA